MTTQGRSFESGTHLFRHCVQDCACDDRMVTAYNQLHGTRLTAPIDALLRHEGNLLVPSADTQEGVELARFILFCYATVWRHVRRVHERAPWPMYAMLETPSQATDELADAVASSDAGAGPSEDSQPLSQ